MLFFAGIVADMFTLYFALWLVARHDSDRSLTKLLMVSSFCSILPFILIFLLVNYIPALILVLLMPFLLIPLFVWVVKAFCWVSWAKAAIVVAIFAALYIARFVVMVVYMGLAVLSWTL